MTSIYREFEEDLKRKTIEDILIPKSTEVGCLCDLFGLKCARSKTNKRRLYFTNVRAYSSIVFVSQWGKEFTLYLSHDSVIL